MLYNLSVSCHRVDCCQRAGPSHYSAPPAQSGDRHGAMCQALSQLSDRGHWSIANLCIIKNLGTLSVKNKTNDSDERRRFKFNYTLDLSFTTPHLSTLLCSISYRNMCPVTWDTQLKHVKIVLALTDQRPDVLESMGCKISRLWNADIFILFWRDGEIER